MTPEQHDLDLERSCIKRDALIDRLLASKDFRRGSSGSEALAKYLSGHKYSNPNGIPTQLRQAQEDVLDLMANEVEPWRT